MSESIAVELKTAPEIKKLILAAFPGYRKRKAYISVFSERGHNVNSYWDGGSKSEYGIVEIATLRRKPLPTTHPYFDLAGKGLANVEDAYVIIDHVGNLTLKAIRPGFVLVAAGTFCGKPATARVYFHPVNMPKYLPIGDAK